MKFDGDLITRKNGKYSGEAAFRKIASSDFTLVIT